MTHLQFKFDTLPTKSTGICLFHQRWIKTSDTQPFCQLCIKYGLVFYKIGLVQFCNKYMVGPTHKKTHFGHSENGKWNFRPKKMKTSLGNIVCHFNMHPCAQYEIIWTNYVMNVAIRLIIWLESHESSRMIARFWEHFFKIIVVLEVYYFSWKLGHIWWHNAKVFQFFYFFYFFMLVSKCGQNDGLDRF